MRSLSILGMTALAAVSDRLETTGSGLFVPTATTGLLLKAAKNLDLEEKKVLDLGCGWGAIGLEIAATHSCQLFMSDFSKPAVEAARRNAVTAEVSADVRFGSIFEPWENEKFDVIIADVSGISSAVPQFSRWFKAIPAATGTTGHELTTAVIEQGNLHLRDGGQLLIPVISLSNRSRALEILASNFSRVEKVARLDWVLPGVTKADLDVMRTLKALGDAEFTEVDGEVICWTEVYNITYPFFEEGEGCGKKD